MIRYVFRDGPVILPNGKNADAQVIGEALADLAAKNDGRLTPRITVAAARRRDHPLHPYFEWTDRKAAEAWRLHQAGQLIRTIRIEDEETQEPMIAFVSVVDKPHGRTYVTREAVVTRTDYQAETMRLAERDLAALERRYQELLGLCRALRSIRAQLTERRRRLLDDGAPPRGMASPGISP
jgi:hypothetical protein